MLHGTIRGSGLTVLANVCANGYRQALMFCAHASAIFKRQLGRTLTPFPLLPVALCIRRSVR